MTCEYPNRTGGSSYRLGCRCRRCKTQYAADQKRWRRFNSDAVERAREGARQWKREHLGQPGLPRVPE